MKEVEIEEVVDLISIQITPKPHNNFLYIGLEHLKSGDTRAKEYASSKNIKSSKFKFSPGDILYGKLRPYLDKVVIADKPGVCSTDIIVLRPKKDFLGRYLVHLFHSPRFIISANSTTSGMNLPRTSWSKIKHFTFHIPFKNGKPVLEKQRQIADKIDELLSEVNSGVEKVEKTIVNIQKLLPSELFRTFKKSGWQQIELGDKNLFHIETGSTPPTKEIKCWENGSIIWVTPKDLGKLKCPIIKNSERKITEFGLSACSATIVPDGSIVVSTRAPIGYVAIADNRLCFNQGCKAIVLKSKDLISEYIYYAVMASVETMQELGKGSTFTEISKNNLEKVKIGIPFKGGKPDVSMQRKIVKKLELLRSESSILKDKYNQWLGDFNLMRQSILSYTFEGKFIIESAPEPVKVNYFQIQQAIGAIIQRFQRGEMVIAKMLYLAQQVYKIPLNIPFTPQNLGPYDCAVKKALFSGAKPSNRFFFRQSNNTFRAGQNINKLQYGIFSKMQPFLDDVLPDFTKKGVESFDIERLATIAMVVEKIQSNDEKKVKDGMIQVFPWKKNKFSENQIEKSLTYIKKRGWDKVLIRSK